MVYQPAEDSYLLEKEVKSLISKLKNKELDKIKVLDMGSGSGIQAQASIKSGIKMSNVLCVDIDEEVIDFLKKQKLQAVQSNLFSNIKDKFNLIIFNAPYLPEDKDEKKYGKVLDTTAGKKGFEIIIKFLEQAKQHLNKEGKILLLFSNLSKPRVILKEAKQLGYKYKKLAEQKLFFEKLFVYEFLVD